MNPKPLTTDPVEVNSPHLFFSNPQPQWVSLFAFLWAMAHLFHLFSDFQTHYAWPSLASLPFLTFLVGLAALAVVATRRLDALMVTAVLQLIAFWLAFPAVSNHWIVVAVVNLAILVAGFGSWRSGWRFDEEFFWRHFAPTGRWILLAFYTFAALAKWNSDFFNPVVSCAVVLGEVTATSFGVLFLFQYPLIRWAVVIGTWAIESSIPLLLFMRRTRYFGVLLGIAFHFALAADWVSHFYDFSSALTALFVLFLPPSFAAWAFTLVEQKISPRSRRLTAVTLFGLLVFLTVAPGPGSEMARIAAFILNQFLWVVFGAGILLLVVQFGRQRLPNTPSGMLRFAHPIMALLPLLMIVNGLMAYGEVRRGRGFDMYSNLRTVAGETNHWFMPTMSLSAAQSDPVVILTSDDTQLAPYVKNDLAVSFLALRKYLSKNPDTAITVLYQNEIVELAHAQEWPELVAPLPWWQEKFLTYKPLDLRPTNRCFDQIWVLD